MRKGNIYWITTILAITWVFVWQFVSLVSLYKLDKESFSDKINDAVYAAVYKLNVLLTDRYPSRDFAGVNASSSCVVYFHGNERDTIIYNSEIQLVDASNRAMYDIHASMWSLEKLDSLFQGQTRKIIGRVPIYYSLLDSVGKILQSHGNKKLTFGDIEGSPVPLGFKMKHELKYNYTYPLRVFIKMEIQPLILLLFLFCAVLSSLIFLFQSLKQARMEAQYRDVILGTIIHNLRTPINNVTGATLEIREELESTMEESDKELFDGMLDELTRMSETTTRLLNLNGSVYGIEIKARETNLPDLIVRIITRYEREFAFSGKNIRFLPCFDMKNKMVQLDSNYFTEIAQNLIDNSIKYSGKDVVIEISCEEYGDKIMIRFKDNGKGITKKYMKYVFKPYSRQNNGNMGEIKGYGLGLYFVKLAVKAHGGKIKLESMEGIGTEFKITLPRKSKYYAED